MHSAFRFVVIATLLCLSAGCYQAERYERPVPLISAPPPPSALREPLADAPGERHEPARWDRMPWENFAPGCDLKGQPLRNTHLLRGDEYLQQGLRRQALAEYARARSIPLSPDEEVALALRIASGELALDRPRESLGALSKYFAGAGKAIEDVPAQFALLFAYAYGRAGNVDQALAWFSQAHRQAGGDGGMAQAAESGVNLLVRSLPDSRFFPLAKAWSTDLFISAALGRESRRRAGVTTPLIEPSPVPTASPGAAPAGTNASQLVAALLPLSGQFKTLGEDTKNGIALVLEGRSDGIGVEFLDTRGDTIEANLQMHALAARENLAVVLGPLLAAEAMSAATIAREQGTPLIALTKRGDFPAGDEVFRLGPTTSSQMTSLLEGTYRALGLVRYALVYPETEGGREHAAVFRETARQLGLEVPYEASYQSADAGSFLKIGEELETQRLDAVFMPSDIDAAAAFMQSISDGLRARITLLGTAAWDDSAKLARSSSLLNNVVFATPFLAQAEDELVQRFVSAYRQRYGKMPDFMAAQGFDAATLAAAAMQRQREQGGRFADALKSIESYNGVTGRIMIGWQGEMERRFPVVQYRHGRLTRLPEKGAPLYSAGGSDEPR